MGKFAVFDIDGTLIRWQLYHALVDSLGKNRLIDQKDYQKLRQARMAWKRRISPNSFKDYERILIEVYESALPKINVRQFDKIAKDVANEYKTQVYTFTRNLIKELKNKGYFLIAISGSHYELVSFMAEQYGFDCYIGTTYVRKDDHFTGKKILANKNKGLMLKKLIAEYDLTYKKSTAIGDSESDISLLNMVENPIAFNPDQKLYTTAKSNGWKIVIERKNVIYHLEERDGKYLLV